MLKARAILEGRLGSLGVGGEAPRMRVDVERLLVNLCTHTPQDPRPLHHHGKHSSEWDELYRFATNATAAATATAGETLSPSSTPGDEKASQQDSRARAPAASSSEATLADPGDVTVKARIDLVSEEPSPEAAIAAQRKASNASKRAQISARQRRLQLAQLPAHLRSTVTSGAGAAADGSNKNTEGLADSGHNNNNNNSGASGGAKSGKRYVSRDASAEAQTVAQTLGMRSVAQGPYSRRPARIVRGRGHKGGMMEYSNHNATFFKESRADQRAVRMEGDVGSVKDGRRDPRGLKKHSSRSSLKAQPRTPHDNLNSAKFGSESFGRSRIQRTFLLVPPSPEDDSVRGAQGSEPLSPNTDGIGLSPSSSPSRQSRQSKQAKQALSMSISKSLQEQEQEQEQEKEKENLLFQPSLGSVQANTTNGANRRRSRSRSRTLSGDVGGRLDGLDDNGDESAVTSNSNSSFNNTNRLLNEIKFRRGSVVHPPDVDEESFARLLDVGSWDLDEEGYLSDIFDSLSEDGSGSTSGSSYDSYTSGSSYFSASDRWTSSDYSSDFSSSSSSSSSAEGNKSEGDSDDDGPDRAGISLRGSIGLDLVGEEEELQMLRDMRDMNKKNELLLDDEKGGTAEVGLEMAHEVGGIYEKEVSASMGKNDKNQKSTYRKDKINKSNSQTQSRRSSTGEMRSQASATKIETVKANGGKTDKESKTTVNTIKGDKEPLSISANSSAHSSPSRRVSEALSATSDANTNNTTKGKQRRNTIMGLDLSMDTSRNILAGSDSSSINNSNEPNERNDRQRQRRRQRKKDSVDLFDPDGLSDDCIYDSAGVYIDSDDGDVCLIEEVDHGGVYVNIEFRDFSYVDCPDLYPHLAHKVHKHPRSATFATNDINSINTNGNGNTNAKGKEDDSLQKLHNTVHKMHVVTRSTSYLCQEMRLSFNNHKDRPLLLMRDMDYTTVLRPVNLSTLHTSKGEGGEKKGSDNGNGNGDRDRDRDMDSQEKGKQQQRQQDEAGFGWTDNDSDSNSSSSSSNLDTSDCDSSTSSGSGSGNNDGNDTSNSSWQDERMVSLTPEERRQADLRYLDYLFTSPRLLDVPPSSVFGKALLDELATADEKEEGEKDSFKEASPKAPAPPKERDTNNNIHQQHGLGFLNEVSFTVESMELGLHVGNEVGANLGTLLSQFSLMTEAMKAPEPKQVPHLLDFISTADALDAKDGVEARGCDGSLRLPFDDYMEGGGDAPTEGSHRRTEMSDALVRARQRRLWVWAKKHRHTYVLK